MNHSVRQSHCILNADLKHTQNDFVVEITYRKGAEKTDLDIIKSEAILKHRHFNNQTYWKI